MTDLADQMTDLDMADKPSTRELPHIPLEILQQIAGHLDRKSAFALTLTCKSLRNAGETKLWKELDITSGWAEPIDDRGFPLPDPSGETWLSLQSITHSRCSSALKALHAYEYRAQCVRSVRLEPSDGVDSRTALDMVALLAHVSPYVTQLDIVPLPWGEDQHPIDISESDRSIVMATEWFEMMADQVPNRYQLACPRLKSLRMGIPTSSEDLLPFIINRLVSPAQASRSKGNAAKSSDSSNTGVTALEELRIESSSSQWADTYDMPPPSSIYEKYWSHAPKLGTVRTLTVGDVEDGTSSDLHLMQLLANTPNIETLRLLVAWGDSGDQARCWKWIANLKKLKKLIIFSAEGLDEDFIGRQELGIEELVMDDAELDEQDELSWTTQKLPRAPKLQRLLLVTSRRPPISEYIELGVSHPAKPIAADRISSRFATALMEYPKLTTVQLHYDEDVFPSLHRAVPEPEYHVPPARWDAEGHRGYVIRSYDNPTNPSAVLYHIRALTRSLERTGETYVGTRRAWRDLSRYRGRTVPVPILDQVYAAAKSTAYGAAAADFSIGREWKEGKRGIRMDSSRAWSILDEWRNAVDDDSDVESSDEEMGDDDEDDDDDDDTDDDADEWEDASDGSAQIEVIEGEEAGMEEGGSGDGEGDWETDSEDPIDGIGPSQ